VGGTYRVALASLTQNRDLRLAQLSSLSAWSGEFLFITATTVYAYDQNGAKGAALISFLRVLPAAVALPLVGALADRMSRRALLIVATLARAVTVVGAAVAAAGHQPLAAYALITLSTVSHAAYRPTLGAMLPSLCTSPEQLAGSNAVRSLLDGLAALIGPLIAAGLLAAFSAPAAFAAVAVLSALSVLLIVVLRYEAPPADLDGPAAVQRGVLAEIWDGMHELRRSRHGSTVIGLGLLQCLVRGALTVFAVIVSVKLAGMGQAGVGVLWAGFGVGGLVAAFASLGAAGSSRLGTIFGTGIAVWGLPLIVCGLLTHSVVAVAAFTIIGAANALVDVSGFTLLQRVVPDHLLARVLALAEAVFALATALGSLIVPPLDSAVGHRGALIASGCVLPAAVVLAYAQLRNIDLHIRVSTDRIALLRRVPMLGLLPVPAIENLARGVTMVSASAGTDVVRKGEVGDNFYVIESGRLSVLDDGRVLRELGPGDSFGEIALIRSVPRTATVRTAEPVELAVVTGARFVAAVNGFSSTASAAEQVVSQHLAENALRTAQEQPGVTDR
jgi:MFS family permease